MSDLSQILGQPVALQLVEKTGKSRYTKTNEIPFIFVKMKKTGHYFLKFNVSKNVNITKQGEYFNIIFKVSRMFVKEVFEFGKKFRSTQSVRIYIVYKLHTVCIVHQIRISVQLTTPYK